MRKHYIASATAISLAVIFSTSTGQAQSGLPVYETIKFDEDFSDDGAVAAKAYAGQFGLSQMQAAHELRLLNRAGKLGYELSRNFSGTFAGVEASHTGGLRIQVYASELGLEEVARHASASRHAVGLASVIEFKSAPMSAVDATRKAQAYSRAFEGIGVDAVIASNARSGQFKVMAKSTTKALLAIAGGKVQVEPGLRIEQFDGIIRTASEFFGGFGYNGSAADCTLGFNVRLTGTTTYGSSTAGHCDDSGRDDRTNKRLDFQEQWITNNVDSQWATVLGGSSLTVVPMFTNGSSVVTVTGGQIDYSGLYICKNGRVTDRTCGIVDQYQYTDGTYGDFPRMNYNNTYPVQALEGDSGGPVFYGTLAVGQVHGRDGGLNNPSVANMYYTPLRAWTASNLPISVICDC